MATKKSDRLPDVFRNPNPPPPGSKVGYILISDPAVRGLKLRVTRNGVKSWVHVRDRSYTIGSFDDWPYPLAREEAQRLNRLVDQGNDPHAERDARRDAPTVADLIEEWRKDVGSKVPPKIRPSSRAEYETIIRQWIVPALGKCLIEEVDRADIEELHRKITEHGTPVRANRVIALVSRIFRVAVDKKWRPDNPASKIEKNREEERYVELKGGELEKLLAAIAQCHNQQSARAIELILLTGARRNEILRLTWDEVDIDRGTITKPPRTTKQKRLHHIPLNTPARQILAEIKAEAEAWAAKYERPMSRWVFPARGGGKVDEPVKEVKQAWAGICRRAGIDNLHLHDCRHIYGYFLASNGTSLYIVGRLLGHSRPTTTQRYAAHLEEDPLREQAERWGRAITAGKAGKSAEIVQHPRREVGRDRLPRRAP